MQWLGNKTSEYSKTQSHRVTLWAGSVQQVPWVGTGVTIKFDFLGLLCSLCEDEAVIFQSSTMGWGLNKKTERRKT